MAILEVINVNKKYPTFELKNVSFNVEPGSITGFIGRNGAGKSTTLKGINGLLHFDSGKVKVFGEDYEKNELEHKQKISFTLPEVNFFMGTTLKKMYDVTKRFYKDWDEEIFKKLCEKFNLDLNKKIGELSSGMKVKYSLAIALSYHAQLFILDEPTSGLDPVSRDEVLDLLRSIVKDGKRAVIFSTHITSDLDKCADHIVYIKNGEIVADDLKEDFINSYLLISGPLDKLDSVKNDLISYKKEKDHFTALILSSKSKLFDEKFEKKKPDLEEVMIYQERKSEDEEFII